MENTFFIPLSGYHLCFDLPSVISDCFPLYNIYFLFQIKCLFYKKYTDWYSCKLVQKIKTNVYKLVKMPVIAPENVEKDKKSQYKWTKYTISNWDFI